MALYPSEPPTFDVHHEEHDPGETLVAGFASFGLAGLTAVDYLTDQLALPATGHVKSGGMLSITPFENGTPRHHTRLFADDGGELGVLVNELALPPWAADPFARAILDWAEQTTVEEITILSGVPIPHGPDEHRTYYVATDDYRKRRLEVENVPPMGSGFLDGINARLVQRGMDSDLRVGVLVTPVHEQTPDAEAALRLTQTAKDLLDIDVETDPLERFAEEVAAYYSELAERSTAVEDEFQAPDRMFM